MRGGFDVYINVCRERLFDEVYMCILIEFNNTK